MPHSPTEMKHRLRVGKVMTIGFVTSGDNPEADLVFFKSKAVGKEAETFSEVGSTERVRDEIWEATSRISRAIQSAVFEAEDDQDPAAIINDSLDQFVAAVRTAAPEWLAGNPVQKHQGHTMPKFDKTKLDDAARAELERVEKVAADATAAAATAVTKAEEAAAAQATAEAAQKTAEDALAAETDPEKGSVTKGMSPEVKGAFEKQAEENADIRKKLDDEIEKGRRDAMSIRFAKGGDFEQLSGDERTDVLLKAQQALDPEDWTKLETMMKAASKQVAEGELLKEAGKEVSESDVGDAQQAFDAEVSKAMEADKTMALPAARAHITKTRSDLYNAVRKERQEANGS